MADPIRRLLLDRLREYDDQSLNIYTNALPQAISDGITNSKWHANEDCFAYISRCCGWHGAGVVLVIAVELFSGVVHPFPEGSTGTMDEICEHVARYPHWVLGVVVVAYSATTFASTWVAARIGNRWAGIVVTLILTLGIVFNIAKLPYAMWFKVVMLSCFAVACYLGVNAGVQRSLPAP